VAVEYWEMGTWKRKGAKRYTFAVKLAHSKKVVEVNWKAIVLAVVLLVAVLFLINIAKPQQQGKKAEQAALILKEVGRLTELNRQQNLTANDFTPIRRLVATSKEAQGELKEAEFFALHGERKHVDHSLPQIYSAFVGMEVPFPLDDLAHASVYLRYNAEQLAVKSFTEARKT